MNKRIFDFFVAFVLLVVVMPLLLGIALWVRVTSPGPVIFRQIRLGYRGMPFTAYKFRSMQENTGHLFDDIVPDDPRITAPGRFLRKTHLDELPQLVNVLLGEMSLVGPRPLPEYRIVKYAGEFPDFRRRFTVRPGMTGLVQIHGRTRMKTGGRRTYVRLDFFYLDHQCLCLDLHIIVRTVGAVLRRRGV
jgi:lipopolysaccharide/colanic/teichoic acid biosynthesis glycosyltransferase